MDGQTAQALAGRLRQERNQARQDALRYNQERNEARAELVALRTPVRMHYAPSESATGQYPERLTGPQYPSLAL